MHIKFTVFVLAFIIILLFVLAFIICSNVFNALIEIL